MRFCADKYQATFNVSVEGGRRMGTPDLFTHLLRFGHVDYRKGAGGGELAARPFHSSAKVRSRRLSEKGLAEGE